MAGNIVKDRASLDLEFLGFFSSETSPDFRPKWRIFCVRLRLKTEQLFLCKARGRGVFSAFVVERKKQQVTRNYFGTKAVSGGPRYGSQEAIFNHLQKPFLGFLFTQDDRGNFCSF